MKYKVKTNIKILKEVWNILKEIGLEGLMEGSQINISITNLLDKLLIEGRLNDVCRIITATIDDFEEKELSEVIEVLTAFFTNIKGQFKGVNKFLSGMPTVSQTTADSSTTTRFTE